MAAKPPSNEISMGDAPFPCITVDQTTGWLFVTDQRLLNIEGKVIINNQIQLAKGQKKIMAMLAALEAKPPRASHRSSVDVSDEGGPASTRQVAPSANKKGGESNGDAGAVTDAGNQKPVKMFDVYFGFFKIFIRDSRFTPLVTHTENLAAYSSAFISATKEDMVSILGGMQHCDALVQALSSYTKEQAASLYIHLSRRYEGKDTQDKKV